MATSGTTVFTVTRDEVIRAALRKCGVIGLGETPANEDFQNCAFSLNLILKSWATKGWITWVYQQIQIPLVGGTVSYNIAPAGGTVTANRPEMIADIFIRDANGYDTPLVQLSVQEYDQLNPKDQGGTPNSWMYDAQRDYGTLYFWPVQPTSSQFTAYVRMKRQLEDVATGASSTQNFDVLQDWFQCLVWSLAFDIGPEYGVNLQKMKLIESQKTKYEEEMADYNQEYASVRFQMSPRLQYQGGGGGRGRV